MTLGVNALCGGGVIAREEIGSRIFVAITGKIYSSDDAGASWQQRFNGIAAHTYGIDRNPSTGVLLACGNTSSGADSLIKSTDGGTTWAYAGRPLGTMNAYTICYVEAINTWFIGGDGGQMRRSTDDGATWTACAIGFGSTFVNRVKYFPHANLLAVLGNVGRLTYSLDGGLTFAPYATIGSTALGGVAYSPVLGVYAMSAYGGSSYTSPDFITWTARATFGSVNGNDIEYHAPSNAFYMATGGTGSSKGVRKNTNILGGGVWSTAYSSGSTDVNSVKFSEGYNGLLFARSASPHVIATSDGNTFTPLAATGAASGFGLGLL